MSKRLSVLELTRMFPDDVSAERVFEGSRWRDGVKCPHCGSGNINLNAKHPNMRHRCRACRRYFSVKTGTVM